MDLNAGTAQGSITFGFPLLGTFTGGGLGPWFYGSLDQFVVPVTGGTEIFSQASGTLVLLFQIEIGRASCRERV